VPCKTSENIAIVVTDADFGLGLAQLNIFVQSSCISLLS
jgi:hypothetical protein